MTSTLRINMPSALKSVRGGLHLVDLVVVMPEHAEDQMVMGIGEGL